MDWRHRNYYLVSTERSDYTRRHILYGLAARSLKSHSPRGHFKNASYLDEDSLGEYYQEMLSCTISDSVFLEIELQEAQKYGNGCSHYLKLTKRMLGQ